VRYGTNANGAFQSAGEMLRGQQHQRLRHLYQQQKQQKQHGLRGKEERRINGVVFDGSGEDEDLSSGADRTMRAIFTADSVWMHISHWIGTESIEVGYLTRQRQKVHTALR